MKDFELDQTIREALVAENDEWLNDLDPAIHESIIEVFKGKSWWVATYAFFVMLALTALAAFSAWKFFHAEATRELVGWATGFLFCATSIGMIKIWYFIEMGKNSVTREIKRFELQLARVTSQLDHT